MKFQCKENLYWHQERGYSGFLNGLKSMSKKEGELVFEQGKKYEMSIGFGRFRPVHIYIFALSADGRPFRILKDTLHGGAMGMIEEHFDISSIIV